MLVDCAVVLCMVLCMCCRRCCVRSGLLVACATDWTITVKDRQITAVSGMGGRRSLVGHGRVMGEPWVSHWRLANVPNPPRPPTRNPGIRPSICLGCRRELLSLECGKPSMTPSHVTKGGPFGRYIAHFAADGPPRKKERKRVKGRKKGPPPHPPSYRLSPVLRCRIWVPKGSAVGVLSLFHLAVRKKGRRKRGEESGA